jgi:hypothetical protein
MLAFSGTRTVHRLSAAIEEAGFSVEEMAVWLYSQGFPKSMRLPLAIDKHHGAERQVVDHREDGRTDLHCGVPGWRGPATSTAVARGSARWAGSRGANWDARKQPRWRA